MATGQARIKVISIVPNKRLRIRKGSVEGLVLNKFFASLCLPGYSCFGVRTGAANRDLGDGTWRQVEEVFWLVHESPNRRYHAALAKMLKHDGILAG